MTTDDYLNLITSAWRQKPKFTSWVSALVAVPVRVQALLDSMTPLFDPDLAVGDQLDIIGQWVGISRNVTIPIPGVYFSWDDVQADGWEYGTWQGDQTPGAVTILPDDAYRNLIKAKIAANHWDGTTTGAYAVWDAVFTTISILIQDNQDMTYDLGFYGGTLDSLTLQLVIGGYIPLKPEGVMLAGIFTAFDTGPMFAWDVETDIFKGWEEGSWVNEIPVT